MTKFNIGDTVRIVGYNNYWDGTEYVIDHIGNGDDPLYYDSNGGGFRAKYLELVTPEWIRGTELRLKDKHFYVVTYWSDHPSPEWFMYRYENTISTAFRECWEPVPKTITVTIELTEDEVAGIRVTKGVSAVFDKVRKAVEA